MGAEIDRIAQAAHVLQDTHRLALATYNEQRQRAWVSPLFFGYEFGNEPNSWLNFYWTSAYEAEHSQNIRQNPNVSLAVYDSHPESGITTGLYVAATAHELTDPTEIARGRAAGDKRAEPFNPDEAFTGAAPRRVYRANARKLWVNDEVVHSPAKIDVRFQVAIGALIAQLEIDNVDR